MSDLPIIKFNPKLPKLTKNEQEVLKLLVEAAELIAPLYLEQERFAKKLSKAEIEQAAKKNPDILSPYTSLEKIKGKIISTPYHIKYAKFLKPIADKLNEVAIISKNKEFAQALKLQAKALVSGTYNEAIIAWLKLKQQILDISIGPVAYYFDEKLFYAKASYQAWVGILDLEGTERLNNYKIITLAARRKTSNKNRIDNYDKVKAKVLDALIFSGLMARTKFVGINLPMDLSIVEKYGSEITLFNQPNDLRIEEAIMPIFNQMFTKEFKEGFSREDLRRGYLRAVALHELAHSYLYYKNAANNLKDLFAIIYELAATVLGLRMAGLLLLKERITEKMLQSMIIAFLCRSFYHMQQDKIHNPLANYVVGGTIFVNFMLENGALKMAKQIAFPNFTKIFVSLHELSDNLEYLLASGSYTEAQNFIKKYIS